MSVVQKQLMFKIFGEDIWEKYTTAEPPENVQGWNGNHPILSQLAGSPATQKIIVDLGVWKGQSTLTLARSMKDNNINGVVLSVDTFLGSPEHWLQAPRLFTFNYGHPNLYELFLRNIIHAELTEYVIPLPQTSATAASILVALGIEPNLVHIDAAHDYDAVLYDIRSYWNILAKDGYIVGDDYDMAWPGVIRAVGEFSAYVCKPLRIEPPKWILQK